ncbi:MAG: dienelactone hydrolase family protein [Pirellulales bacterium]|nr:dienelactone hydrolase family protein [Pirellulales bacterium]
MMQHGNLSRRQYLASLLAGCSLPSWLRAAESELQEDVSWLADVQRPPAPRPADAPRLGDLLIDDDGRKITTLDGWKRRRDTIRRRWHQFLGPLPRTRQGPPPWEVIAEDRPAVQEGGGVVRQLIRYEVEPGLPVEAYLLKPSEPRPRCPGVVVLHSTVRQTIRQPAGVEGSPEKAFGLKMARRGYAAICPRCFLWSDDLSIPYDEHVKRFRARHPRSKGMAKMLHDATVAVDILAALPEVDPQRLGAVGHSLGAKEVLYLAAFDERVRVAVSSEGGIGTRFSNWDAPWYLGKDVLREGFTREHHELLALVAPRPFLLLGGDSADGARSWPFVEAVLPVYRLYGGTPRVGLFNHRQGHSVPPEAARRIDQWFDTYCRASPQVMNRAKR